jgi:hypothetical protein
MTFTAYAGIKGRPDTFRASTIAQAIRRCREMVNRTKTPVRLYRTDTEKAHFVGRIV